MTSLVLRRSMGTLFTKAPGMGRYARNASDGALLWSYTTGNTIGSSAAVDHGVVYIGSNRWQALRSQFLDRRGDMELSRWRSQPTPRPSGGWSTSNSWIWPTRTPWGRSLLQAGSRSRSMRWRRSASPAVGAISIVLSFANNPLSALGEGIGEKSEDLVPRSFKEWLGEIVSSKQKTDVIKKRSHPAMRTMREVLCTPPP